MTFKNYLKEKHQIDFLTDDLKRIDYDKNEYITQIGDTEKYCYFIESGIVEVEISKKTETFTFDILFETEFCSAYASLISQTPSDVALKCLTPCTLIRIPFLKLHSSLSDNLKFQKFLLTETNRWYLKRIQKEKDLLLYTAKERYLKILTQNSDLIQSIPLYKLASYLKITPESLSRIRKDIS